MLSPKVRDRQCSGLLGSKEKFLASLGSGESGILSNNLDNRNLVEAQNNYKPEFRLMH